MLVMKLLFTIISLVIVVSNLGALLCLNKISLKLLKNIPKAFVYLSVALEHFQFLQLARISLVFLFLQLFSIDYIHYARAVAD